MERNPQNILDDDASGLALICRFAVQARTPDAQLAFLESLIADLTEIRDDLLHQAALTHHSHQEL